MLLDQRVRNASLGQRADLGGSLRTLSSRALRAARGRPESAWQVASDSTSVHSRRLGQARHVTASHLPLRAADRRVVAPHASVVGQGHSITRSIAVPASRSRVSGTAAAPDNPAVEPRYLSPAVSLHAKYPTSNANVQPRGRIPAAPSSSRHGSSHPSALIMRGTNGSSNASIINGRSSGSRRRRRRKKSTTLQEPDCTAAEVIAAENVSQQQQHPAVVAAGMIRGRPPPNRPKPRSSYMRGLYITNDNSPQQQPRPNGLRPQPPPVGIGLREGLDDTTSWLQHLRGVGEATAKMIGAGLAGRDVAEVFDSDDAVELLSRIKGIGAKKAAQFKMSWDASKGADDTIPWLQQYGMPLGAARSVAEEYKSGAKGLAATNPYIFIDTVSGFRFRDAEHLAASLGVDPGAPERAAAALRYTLKEAASRDSETAVEWKDLQDRALNLLKKAEEDVIKFLIRSAAACNFALKKLRDDITRINSSSSGSEATTPSPLGLLPVDLEDIAQCESELSAELGVAVQFNEGQRQAMALVAALPVVLVTGGPGCGKTLTSQAIARGWLDAGVEVALAAPTGRAAQRLQEQVSSHEFAAEALGDADDPLERRATLASTIHRLLGYGHRSQATAAEKAATAAAQATGLPYDRKFAAAAPAASDLDDGLDPGCNCRYNKFHQLSADCVLVDEVSMMDVGLAAALFNASRNSALVLVGDPDQLPPVGPGRPLAAALAAGVLPCVDLRQIYRSAAGSAIVMAAHAINQGRMPDVTMWDLHPDNIAADLAAQIAAVPRSAVGKLQLPSNALMLRLPDTVGEVSVRDALMQAVQQLVPLLECDPQLDVQVLCPRKMNSAIGAEALNQNLQKLLNPQHEQKQEMSVLQQPLRAADSRSAKRMWREGDRVMHLENDFDREVYNGDLGYIEKVDHDSRRVTVRYPPRNRTSLSHRVGYAGGEMNQVVQLAWATTVHKAQGGEYPVVMMPVHASASQYLLRRPLLYTGVSRAKQLLVIVGTVSALQQCLNAGATAAGCSVLLQHQQHQHHKHSSAGWYDSVQGTRLYERLRAEAAAKGLQPLHRMVYGPDGWVQQAVG